MIGSTPLVKFDLAALGDFQALGLTSDAPARHFNVQVRDSKSQLIAFNGTTFDPTGTGAKTLTLNSANAFRRTLLLPAGTYTFENAVKDDATDSTLLAYGPASENSAAISGDGAVVRLKYHAVFDKASSTLDFSTNMARLFTNSTFNLSLSLKTSPVSGTSATVPTTDIGAVTYTLGNATDGVLNNAGSKIGVNVTARGTDTDSTLNVTASFDAWIRNAGTDTATYGPTSVDFAKAIETNAMVADTVSPALTFSPVGAAYVNSGATLSGTATDDVQMGEIRVYDDAKLVASNVAADGVTAITTNANGNWGTRWTPATQTSHDLTVVADSSGNETRAVQTVSVDSTPPFTLTSATGEVHFNLTNGVLRTFKVIVPNNSSLFFALFNPGGCTSACSPQGPKQFTSTMVNAQGQSVALQFTTYNGNGYDYTSTMPAGEYFVTVTPTADTTVSLYGYIR
ncbi:hypothetical protein DEIPH_ctg027orf0001 [Deinococcus phoenicis]|uniref:Uncharacterized protein n=1 Tax=Deinococcus phoenicis TaxID=1476583 RepID=A0A016QPV6_9DEIO|nr:hypothetical protein [Deinococcus phoenicis]EYB68073.1 hypothetical protein DEIPH_ctg027orf0001 [Deinococcus phoenicis]